MVDRVRDSTRLIELGCPMPIREFVRHSNMWGKATIELAVTIVGLLVQKEIRVVLGIARRVQRATVN